jgi:hypothetical protein
VAVSSGPPEVHELVLELDAAYYGNALDAANEADESHELTYVDIDTFLALALGRESQN